MARVQGLFIGINYTGNGFGVSELQGCVTDAATIKAYVDKTFNPDAGDVKSLYDSQATRSAIFAELDVLKQKSANSLTFVYYSGHGTYSPDSVAGGDESDGYDEMIVPFDLNLITDDDFYQNFTSQLDPTCTLVLIVDACNSGTFADALKKYYLNPTNSSNPTFVAALENNSSSRSFPGKVFGLSASADDEFAREGYFPRYGTVRGYFTVALQELWVAQNLTQLSAREFLRNLQTSVGTLQTVTINTTEILQETSTTFQTVFSSLGFSFKNLLSDPSAWTSLPVSVPFSVFESVPVSVSDSDSAEEARKEQRVSGNTLMLLIFLVSILLFLRR